MSAFKVATREIDLEPYGGEGKIKVKGLNTKVSKVLAEIDERCGGLAKGNTAANIEASVAICLNCIVEAPFEINEDVIYDFPPKLTEKIVATVLEMEDGKFPLD